MRNFISILFILLSIISCKKNKDIQEKIIKIESKTTPQAGQEILSITKDSIKYFNSSIDVGIARKNTPQDWEHLLKTFKLEDFKKLKQGREHIVYDGTDEMLSITTDKGNYSVRNAYEDSINYPKIEALTKELENIENKITEKHIIK